MCCPVTTCSGKVQEGYEFHKKMKSHVDQGHQYSVRRRSKELGVFPVVLKIHSFLVEFENLSQCNETMKKGLDSINIHYYIHLEGSDQQVAPIPNPHIQRNRPHLSPR